MAGLIVCERTGAWASALAVALAGRGVRLRETRSLEEAREELAGDPASCVAVALDVAEPSGVLRFISGLEGRHPLARSIALAPRSMAGYEWLAREAGAVAFIASPRGLTSVAQLVARHLQRTPQSPRSVVERIRASLPWSDFARRA